MNGDIHCELQNQIDRLVGGDLSKIETRTLVDRLDSEPQGWKRCGLAFLEARSWQTAFAELTAPADRSDERAAGVAAPQRIAVADPAGRRRRAALIAVAFLIGAGLATAWRYDFGRTGGPRTAAAPTGPEESAPGDGRLEGHAGGLTAQQRAVGLVRISTGDGTETAFPVVGGTGTASPGWVEAAGELTEYDIQIWQRRGYQVEQHRKLVSLVLADGNRFQFPVDWVHYRYVGQRVY